MYSLHKHCPVVNDSFHCIAYMCNEIFGERTACQPKDETDCKMYGHEDKCVYRSEKPDGIAVEMVDCIIRILDYLSKIGVDIEKKHRNFDRNPLRAGCSSSSEGVQFSI